MFWKGLWRSLSIFSVSAGVLLGAAAVAFGVVYGSDLVGIPWLSHFGTLVFFIAVVPLGRVGSRILWPHEETDKRLFPLTRHQRVWGIGWELKSWADSFLLSLLAIGGGIAAGVGAHRLGMGPWVIGAVVVLVWGAGVVTVSWLNAWTSRKLERYRPESEADTLLKTFD